MARKRPSDRREQVGCAATLRIIGGRFRGRRLKYSGDPRVRPMKDRVREAFFNLVGPSVRDKHTWDLFAGTGAVALESISRGAKSATVIEQHFPTARIVEENADSLGVRDRVQVIRGDLFVWIKHADLAVAGPWLVCCCPPYRLYEERRDDMLDLIALMLRRAPAGSVLVVEADEAFDFGLLPEANAWDVRTYRPAVLGILRVSEESGSRSS